MQQLVTSLAPGMGMSSHVEVAKEAARLGRADLGSAVVTELTSLAGTMGRIYAQHAGEVQDNVYYGLKSRPQKRPGKKR